MRFRVLTAASVSSFAAMTLVVSSLAAQAPKKPLPLKYVGPPTVPGITAGDLMTRLYKYADDSMMGRDVGSIYHLKAAAFIEGELRRMGLKPGGTNGSFYQDFPVFSSEIAKTSAITIGARSIPLGKDFLVVPAGTPPNYNNLQVVYAGMPNDTTSSLDSASVAGKLLIARTFPLGWPQAQMAAYRTSTSYKNYLRARSGAAGYLVLYGEEPTLPADMVADYTSAGLSLEKPVVGGPAAQVYISVAVAEAMFGAPLTSLKRGAVGQAITLKSSVATTMAQPGRNVIAVLPGSDPVLKNQYVAIGAHSDHVGFGRISSPSEHDSLAITGRVAIPAGAEGGRDLAANPITPDEWKKINAEIAELRKVYPPREDSISNGADDDGSGTVSVLEIAEAFAKGALKPKRSIIFVWHAGEEHGMWGSGFFMDNPTIPRDSIVAQFNIDMVGRGAATDITGQAKGPVDGAGNVVGPGADLHGGDRYLQLVGSRRLSTELGDLVEKVNTDGKHGFKFDYNIDADGHQQDIYCRSDHWSYAKWGIPIVFFTTGGHSDYHQVTDEPQYIRYDHMAGVDSLIFDIASKVANLDHKVVVDKPKPKPAPALLCKQ